MQQQGLAQQMGINPGWITYSSNPLCLNQCRHLDHGINATRFEGLPLPTAAMAEPHPSGIWQGSTHTQSFAPSYPAAFQDFDASIQQEPLSLQPSSTEPVLLGPSKFEPFELDPLELDSFSLNTPQESSPPKHFIEQHELNDFMIKVTDRLDR